MKLFAISTVRNEADIVGVMIRYHLDRGVDRFLVIDNGSTDGTTDQLADLSRADARVSWTHDPGAWQHSQALTHLAQTAARDGADWVFSIDADEFWTPTRGHASLKSALATVSGGSVVVDVVNFVQDRRQLQHRPDALGLMGFSVADPVGPPIECERLVESGEISYLEAEYPGKLIARAAGSMTMATGGHSVTGVSPEAQVRTEDIVCLHAPLRSRSTLDRKAEQGYRCEVAGRSPGESWHVRRWYRLSGTPGELDREWVANSHLEGALNVRGRSRSLVPDTRLRDAVAPYLTAPGG